jgi:hypothetical protein
MHVLDAAAAAHSNHGVHSIEGQTAVAQGLIPLLMSRITAYFPLETIYTPVVHETRHPGGAWPSMEGASRRCSSIHVRLSCKWRIALPGVSGPYSRRQFTAA